MDYQQFLTAMESEVRQYVKRETEVSIKTTMKNNGVLRRGLMVSERGINISPTIYMEEYYELYQEGKPLKALANQIFKMYEEVRFQYSFEGSYLKDYECVKDSVVYKLINREKNTELLRDVPYVLYQDFAIVFYVLIQLKKDGTATMLIKNEHLGLWGVTKEEVYTAAKKNSWKLLPAEFKPMREVLYEMMELKACDYEREEDVMYVLTNRTKNLGAAALLYEGVKEMIGEILGENYYVLPSSIHEVIIVPESKGIGKRELEEIVTEINESHVEKEEILSNHVYFFDQTIKTLVY